MAEIAELDLRSATDERFQQVHEVLAACHAEIAVREPYRTAAETHVRPEALNAAGDVAAFTELRVGDAAGAVGSEDRVARVLAPRAPRRQPGRNHKRGAERRHP